VLYVLLFLITVPGHFSSQMIDYAAAHGTPLANVAVPLSGVLALLGGLSVALGYKARIGALLLALFLIPVTIIMHRFWGLHDAQAAMLQRVMFFKNLSLLGTTALIGYFGAGPFSLDSRAPRRAPAPPTTMRST
jgi:putative oxidoreductase